MNVQQILESISERVSTSASVKNIYGDPVTIGERIVIPAASVRYGFGGGGGSRTDTQNGGGGGGGVSARPSGVLEITAEGARFIGFEDRRKTAIAIALGFLLGLAVASLSGGNGSKGR
jgi:uncharacterized spore protein YtfJ